MYSFDTHVPFPVDALAPRPKGKPRLYPWHEMQVGHSLWMQIRDRIHRGSINSSLSAWMRAHPEQFFAVRLERDGIRVWRVK